MRHRIGEWSRKNSKNKKYRQAQAEGSRRYQEQLHRDAEFGRMARAMLAGVADILKQLADLEKGSSDGR